MILDKKITQYIIIGILMLGAFLCIFPPKLYFFKSMSEYAVQIMFGYLFLGLGFLLIKQPRLMFASYIACSILAIHLKLNTNPDLKSPEATEDQAVIDIAVMDISNITQEPNETLDAIFESDACLLSLPNIDLDIYEFIRDTLREKYPYATERVGFEPGIALFSKYKISRKDTFFVDGLPNIVGSIRAEGRGQELYFITSNTLPPFYTRDYDRTKRQLNRIADIVNTIGAPILTFADYNLVPWSDEIHDFRDKAHLKDSRRGFTPASSTSLIGSFFDSPRDHIFFSEHFKCIGFENLKSSTYKHLGIKGSFQFNPTVVQ